MKTPALAVLAIALGRPAQRRAVLRPAPPNLALPEETRAPAPFRTLGAKPLAPPPAAPVVMIAPAQTLAVSPHSSATHREAKARSKLQVEQPSPMPPSVAPAIPGHRLAQGPPPSLAKAEQPVSPRPGMLVTDTLQADHRPSAQAPRSRVQARNRPKVEQGPAPDHQFGSPPPDRLKPPPAEIPAHLPEPQGPASTPPGKPPEQSRAANHALPDQVLAPLPPPPEAHRAAPPDSPSPRSAEQTPIRSEIRIGTIEIRTTPSPAPASRVRAEPSRAVPTGQQVQRLSRGYGWLGRG